MAKTQMKIKGLTEWYKLLDGLPKEMKAKALQSVHRKAANDVIKANVTSRHDADIHTNVVNEKGEPTGILVGISSKAYWLRFIEYGTNKRTTKSGANKGRVKSQPFWRQLIDSRSKELIAYIDKNYAELIGKFVERKVKSINRVAKNK